MPKPTTFTPDIAKAVVAEVKLGLPLKLAADFVRVPRSTFAEWRQRGADPRTTDDGEIDPRDQPLVDFVVDLNQAVAFFARGCTQSILRGDKSSNGKMFLLERRFPDEYGKQDRVVVERRVCEELESMLNALRENLPQEEYERALRAIDRGEYGASSVGADQRESR